MPSFIPGRHRGGPRPSSGQALGRGVEALLARGRPLLGKRIAMSVEGTALRVLACQGREVSAWGSVPFNPSLLRNGFVANSSAMAEVMRLALRGKELDGSQVLASLPGLQSASRVITLPPVAGVKPAVVLPREVRRLMPISIEDSYLHWQPLPRAGARRQFFVLAVPKEPVLTLLDSLSQARLKASAMDTRPLALARAANRSYAIVACVENTTIDIVVVAGDIPAVSRSLLLGEEPVSAEEALPRLLDELGRSLSFYSTTYRENPLPPDIPVLLCGALSQAPAIAPAVEDATGRPVAQPQPPLKFPPHFPLAEFVVNLGLVLKEL